MIKKFLTLLLMASAINANEKPNVIIINSDDYGIGDVNCYNQESKFYTPAIDALAARGMRFTDHHTTASTCAPTRYSILTGNYVQRGLNPRGVWNYSTKSQILEDQKITLGKLMQQAGYNTAMLGKFHIGGTFYERGSDNLAMDERDYKKLDFSRPFKMGPLDLGFDYSFILPNGIQESPYAHFENDVLVGDQEDLVLQEGRWTRAEKGQTTHRGYYQVGMPYWDFLQVGPVLANKALGFIDNHYKENQDKPFFLYFCTQSIHGPNTAAKEINGIKVAGITAERHPEMKGNYNFCSYGDFVYETDVTIRLLMEDLEKRGELKNTLFIFTADNGASPGALPFGQDSSGLYSGFKGSIWEGGHRVPFIAAWGDGTKEGSLIEPGSVNNNLIGQQDIYGTLAELTGQAILQGGCGQDSISFLSQLKGDSKSTREFMYSQGRIEARIRKPKKGGSKDPEARMMRKGKWKLCVHWDMKNKSLNDKPFALYNLEEDPQEENDMLKNPEYKKIIEEMLAEVAKVANIRKTNAPKGSYIKKDL